jgi:hypothetical protein
LNLLPRSLSTSSSVIDWVLPIAPVIFIIHHGIDSCYKD